jgi:hypothetical protein
VICKHHHCGILNNMIDIDNIIVTSTKSDKNNLSNTLNYQRTAKIYTEITYIFPCIENKKAMNQLQHCLKHHDSNAPDKIYRSNLHNANHQREVPVNWIFMLIRKGCAHTLIKL